LWEKKEKNKNKTPVTLPTSEVYQKVSSKKTMNFVTSVTRTAVSQKLMPGTIAHCSFCGNKGVIVEKFPRRGYGKVTRDSKIRRC